MVYCEYKLENTWNNYYNNYIDKIKIIKNWIVELIKRIVRKNLKKIYIFNNSKLTYFKF